MKQLPLTNKQVEICDYILRNNNIEDTYGKLEDIGHSDFDNRIASKFLVDNKLITTIHPVVLTDTGSQYTNKGIVKFIKDKRRNEFIKSPIFTMWFVIIPIILSLIFNVTNCRRTNQIKNEDGLNKKQYEQIDSIIKMEFYKLDKFTTKESVNDTSKLIGKIKDVKTE